MGEDPLLDIAGLWKFQGFLSLEFLLGSSFFSPWVKNVKIPARSLVTITKGAHLSTSSWEPRR